MTLNLTNKKIFPNAAKWLGAITGTLLISCLHAQSDNMNYPDRYMGGDANIIKAPSDALIYDKVLEGKENIPTLILPEPEIIAQSPITFVNYHRVRIDPKRSETTDQVIVLNFGEKGKAGLHIRRGIAEFVLDPDRHYNQPDIVISLNADAWAKLYLNQSDFPTLFKEGKAILPKGGYQKCYSAVRSV